MRLQPLFLKHQYKLLYEKKIDIFSSEFKKSCGAKIPLNCCNKIKLVLRKDQ
jgi:hypothetical protein